MMNLYRGLTSNKRQLAGTPKVGAGRLMEVQQGLYVLICCIWNLFSDHEYTGKPSEKGKILGLLSIIILPAWIFL